MTYGVADERPAAGPLDEPGGPISALQAFPSWLAAAAGDFTDGQARVRPSPGAFSLVEHVHHLLDLEVEGYWVRLRRLLASERPFLPDLDGARLARKRQYRVKPLWPGLTRFSAARAASVDLLRTIPPAALVRTGDLEGVGPITLGGLIARWVAHDAAHRAEIDALRAKVLGGR
jgi:hypothetical protein